MNKKCSILIPMKNESDGLDILFRRLLPVLNKLPIQYEIVIVNDGSSDDTLKLLLAHKETIPELKVIDLSRNFGKESALYAGFANCKGDCAIAIDADLQDPPELIIEMIDYWLEGYEVITAVRKNRNGDSFMKKLTASLFYRFINKISDVKLIRNGGDFRLLDRSAINAFLTLDERVRFNKGIFTWLGFKQKLVYHDREERAVGKSKWGNLKLINFSIDGITSFSITPLEIWFYCGLFITGISFIYAFYYFINTLLFGIKVNGYPSLLMFIIFFSGLQMIGIGILGKYIGRIFIESKRRPIFIVRKIYE